MDGSFRLSGQKVWSSGGHVSDWCMLLARTGSQTCRHRGLTMFWLDMSAPGVSARPIACLNGRNELAEIFLDDVVVPASSVVGPRDGGWDVAMYLLQFERGTYAWQRQAWARSKLVAAVAAAPDGPEVAAAIGEAFLAWSALRARSRETVMALARDEAIGPEASIDKILLSQAEQAVLDAARVVLWPAFELDDSADGQAWRRDWYYTRAASIYGGAVEVQRDIVGERIAGLPRG